MRYIQLRLKIDPFSTGISEILIAGLNDLGYEGFQEAEPFLLAFIPENNFYRDELDKYIERLDLKEIRIQAEHELLPDLNWNAEWEKNFMPVVLEGICAIVAPWHAPVKGLTNIVIEPKMSFGTGHHETTRLMLRQMHGTDLTNQTVLDMGCGTGVLGIFALKKGAKSVTSIDIDEWAFRNSQENFRRNGCKTGMYDVVKGDAGFIPAILFDTILANINRNLILKDMPAYKSHLSPKGTLILSGILSADKNLVLSGAVTSGLSFISEDYDNNWISLKFRG